MTALRTEHIIPPQFRGQLLRDMRPRKRETHLRKRDLGDPRTDVGQHNLRLWAELQLRLREQEREIADNPELVMNDVRKRNTGQHAKPGEPSCVQIVMALLQSDPSRVWTVKELNAASGRSRNTVSVCLWKLRHMGLATQIKYGHWRYT